MKDKLKGYLNVSLKRQLIFYIIIGVLVPLILMMTILFLQTRTQMKKQAIQSVKQQMEIVANQIEQLVYNVHSVSDNNAYNEQFEEYTMKYYGTNLLEKRRDIQLILTMFAKSDLFGNNIQMAGVLTRYRELMNFQDFMVDSEEVIERLYKMGIDEKKNLSKIIWFPVQENFLIEGKSGEIREDKVIIGTRRIVNFYSGATNAIHIFAIPEEEIFQKYRDIVTDLISDPIEEKGKKTGEIYIINPNGEIISTSDINALEKGYLTSEILEKINQYQKEEFEMKYHGEQYFINIKETSNTDWKIIAMIRATSVTRTIDYLFYQIILVASFSGIIILLIILYLTKKFLAPINLLKESMQTVYEGNLDAYVDLPGKGEIQEMGDYYNSMLRKINEFIIHKIKIERKKKELELQVIMGQVNPHFLYNTLENIVWKSSEAGCPEISRMAASLGRLYRLSISDGKIIVRIQQEIEHLMAYVNIQKMRYQERVEFDLLVDYEQIRNYQTIKLILQPVVENCYMYAMEDIDHVLNIWVRVKVFKEVIRYEIIDNGLGIRKEQLFKIREEIKNGRFNMLLEEENGKDVQKEEVLKDISIKKKRKGTGVGLYSVNERIKLYFGKENAVTIRSKVGIGTVVAITIPKIKKSNKELL